MPSAALPAELDDLSAAAPNDGIVFNSDDLPGGPDAAPAWRMWILRRGITLPLFEFHASRAALQMAHQVPSNVFRAHALPALEAKDLSPAQERSRWRRAVEERSCRYLLPHVSPADSFDSFLIRISALRDELSGHGWILASPVSRAQWTAPSFLERWACPWAAFLAALCVPFLGLRTVWRRMDPVASISWIRAFLWTTLVSVCGGLLVAAIAQSPWTRLEIEPFRSVKLLFIVSWAACLFVLYSRTELNAALSKSVRRWDVVSGGLLLCIIGYALVRSGNAASGWKFPMEQALRDRLETLLLARPRFKEFAV